MPTLFSSLNNGYTGLKTTQVGINTVGHNISNAENEGYTRQRVVIKNAIPLQQYHSAGQHGQGARISEIVRIHDDFVFSRYKNTSSEKEYSEFLRQNLEEISTYFPEIDNVGVKNDLHEYFNAWSAMAQNPNSSAVKIDLAQKADSLSRSIKQTREALVKLQQATNDEFKTTIDEINSIGSKISELNRKIHEAESGGFDNANDLRDERGKLEVALAKLVDIELFRSNTTSQTDISRSIKETEGVYNINIGGISFVDGKSFHKLIADGERNPAGLYNPMYERQDGVTQDITEDISGGRIGAELALRGRVINDETGVPEDGLIQETLNYLDTFTKTFIHNTNRVYAQAATTNMTSRELNVDDRIALIYNEENINEGDFDVIMYDPMGNEVARKNITIDDNTFMAQGENSVLAQLNAKTDDNADNNTINDIDDKFMAIYKNDVLQITSVPGTETQGYSIAIEDRGTNFSGSLGLNNFFEGQSAADISLREEFKNDSTKITGYAAPDEGNNVISNAMLQLQYERLSFKLEDQEVTESLAGFYDYIASDVASKTDTAIARDDTITAQFNAIKGQYESISKVSVDEELAQLIKYQTAYGASAKVVTTVDRMVDTLLGIKQ